jgi:O-acetyl-ADP-ribose deacetylase (regulator of RNase III)
MAEIKEINGLIFNSNCQVLVNTVNCEGVMGGGIALEFKLRFPDEMFLQYERICKKGLLKPGKLLLYDKNNPWILNFPTKNKWKLPSKMSYITTGLEKFCSVYKAKKIQSIAFPRLGSSSGGLNWQEVKEEMYEYLFPLEELYVEIYSFDPNKNFVDDLYIKLKNKVKNYSVEDLSKELGLRKKQFQIFKDIIDNYDGNKMIIFQKTKGLGRKAIKSIYDFAKEDIEVTDYQELKLF